jgi:hypothetical protein
MIWTVKVGVRYRLHNSGYGPLTEVEPNHILSPPIRRLYVGLFRY